MTTRQIIFLILISGLLTSTVQEAGAKTAKLVTWEIPGWVQNKNAGIKIEILKEIKKKTGLSCSVTLLSPKRAALAFRDNKVDGMFPALDVNIPKPVNRSEFYTEKNIYALSRVQEPDIKSFTDLKGLKICVIRGYSYPNAVTANRKLCLDFTGDAGSCVNKVDAGRVGVFLGEKHTIEEVVRELGFQEKMKISRAPIFKMGAYFAFQPNDKGKRLAEEFSGAIREMKIDGSLSKILSRTKE